jgi:hypothetical protein
MSTSSASTLENVIRQSDQRWLLEWPAGPGEKPMDSIRERLRRAREQARVRFGANAPDLSEEAIVAEYKRNPQGVSGFFQALGGTGNPEMLLMAWRIIQGMEIKEISLAYRREETFEAWVVLQSRDGGEDEKYVSTNVYDFALFRHFGKYEMNGRPVFSGFYALKVEAKQDP